jgi:hypothetical protein
MDNDRIKVCSSIPNFLSIQAMTPPCNTLIYAKPFFTFLFVHLPLFLGLELNLSSFLWFPSAMTLPLSHCSPSPCYAQLLAFHFEILVVIFLFLLLLPIEVNLSAHPKIVFTNTSLSRKLQ